jgi:peptidoglycan/LPS O-acetylase OafA/YrhL
VNESKLRGLDGLRALAALAVFFVHYNQIVDVDVQLGAFDVYLFLANGEVGVALFFILSGTLLSLPYWRAILLQQEWPKLKTYFKHRFARIIPAYYLALTILIVLSNYWRLPASWQDIALHYSFLFNYAEFSFFSINSSFWTLAVEMQFYLLLPCFFALFRPLSYHKTLLLFGLLAMCFYGLHYFVISSVDNTIMWPGGVLIWVRLHGAVLSQSLLAHLPHFIIGIITGGLLLKGLSQGALKTTCGKRAFDGIFILSMGGVILMMGTPLGYWFEVPMGRYGLPVLPLLLALIVFVTPFTSYCIKVLDVWLVRHLGKISYGIYIWHLPILTWVDHEMALQGMDAIEHGAYLLLFSGLLTLLVANLSYYLVERRIMRLVH